MFIESTSLQTLKLQNIENLRSQGAKAKLHPPTINSKDLELNAKRSLNKSTETYSIKVNQESPQQQSSQRKKIKMRNRLLMLEQLSESVRNDSSTSECSMPNINQIRSDENILDPYRQSLRERTKSTLNPSSSVNLSN